LKFKFSTLYFVYFKVKSTHNFDTKNDLLYEEESNEDFDAFLIKVTEEAELQLKQNENPRTPKRRRSSANGNIDNDNDSMFDSSINEILSAVPLELLVAEANNCHNVVEPTSESRNRPKQSTPLRTASMPISPQILKPVSNSRTNVFQRHISLPPNQNRQADVVRGLPSKSSVPTASTDSVYCELAECITVSSL
jgi:hypothetical protein